MRLDNGRESSRTATRGDPSVCPCLWLGAVLIRRRLTPAYIYKILTLETRSVKRLGVTAGLYMYESVHRVNTSCLTTSKYQRNCLALFPL